MSRIRSIHPGLTTDESYMALSHAAARIWPSLWCECDDHGVFEWKPLTLKAKLLPVHSDDMTALLEELLLHNLVKRFDLNGRSYGAVRNFCRYQKPKKPKFIHVLPAEFRTYVALDDAGSEQHAPSDDDGSPPTTPLKEGSSPPVPHRYGKTSADGGGRMEDGEEEIQESPPSEVVGAPSAADLAAMVEAYNQVARDCGLPTVARLTDQRRAKARSRLRDCGGLDGWSTALAKLRANRWMHGENDRGWRADFDFLLQPKSFTRLMEGGYDRTGSANGHGSGDGNIPQPRPPQGPPPKLSPGWDKDLLVG